MESIEIKLNKKEMEAIILSLQITTHQYDFRNGTKEKYMEYVQAQVLLENLQDTYRIFFTSEVL